MRWLMPTLTLVFAALTITALVSHLNGNPTAVNGIIGAGFGTVLFAVLWWIDWS